MTTATKGKRKSKAINQANAERLSVEYGNVSIGEETASIGVRIRRESLNIMAADELFCGRRLMGQIVVHAGDEDAQQTHLGDVKIRQSISGSFDVKRFGVSPKHISARLVFVISEIEVGELAEFSKQRGSLIVEQALEIERAAKPAPAPEEAE